MKILLNANYDHPLNQGGVSTFNRNIVKIFGERLSVLCYKTNKKRIHTQNFENIIEIYNINSFIKKIDNKILKNHLLYYTYIKNLKKIKPDVIIMNEPKDLKAINNENVKKILVQHMDYNIYIKYYYKGIHDLLIEKTKEEVDFFICLSEYNKKRFMKELNFPEKKIKVIRHMSEIEIKKDKKIKNKNLIMIARLENNSKRFDLAIKAMKKLSDFNLKIYGDGDKKFLKDIIKENNIKNVYLCGSTNQVKEKLDESGIYIMTSDYEGYPISLIEAMRRGLPIVLRNTFDAAPDIIKNNGILLKKKWNEDKFIEAVIKIYNNYEYYSENSKKLGERYNFEVIRKEWENLIKEL